MTNQFICPFCGANGVQSREHVWPQWLHSTPGARELLKDSKGERSKVTPAELSLVDGTYDLSAGRARHVATLLPHVTVPVCKACNTGWMSQLEVSAQAILEPFIKNRAKESIGEQECRTLSPWATKCWMAYALTRSPQHNPFRDDDYRRMANEQRPPSRLVIRAFCSDDPGSLVSLLLSPSLLTRLDEVGNLDQPDNVFIGVLAAGGVVFFATMHPEGWPELADFLEPEWTQPPPQIWPVATAHLFPSGPLREGSLQRLFEYPDQLWKAIGLPVVGLTPEEAAGVADEFANGADPSELRERHS